MSGANYKYFTRPSATWAMLCDVSTDMQILETKLDFSRGKGQIGGCKLFLSSLLLVKKN